VGGAGENTCESPVRVILRGSDTRRDCPQSSPVVPSSQVVVHSERASEKPDGGADSLAPGTRHVSKEGRSPRIEALGTALSDAEPTVAFVSTNDDQPDSCESEIQPGHCDGPGSRGGVGGCGVLCGAFFRTGASHGTPIGDSLEGEITAPIVCRWRNNYRLDVGRHLSSLHSPPRIGTLPDLSYYIWTILDR
jgi:hypothetical protein